MAAGARLAAALGELILPRGCAACGCLPSETEPAFCSACGEELVWLQEPFCPRCGRPGGEGLCPACRRVEPAFDRARSLLAYAGAVGRAVRRFKYRRSLAAGAELAGMIARRTPREHLAGAELLLPVPLHPWRRLRRGFNQACVLFRPLARRQGLRLAAGLLRRRRHTRPQVGLDAAARRENVAGAFELARGAAKRVRGRRVLLLDDVFTTGATAAECARVLKGAGAAWVGVLTLVRARGHPGGGLRPEAGPDMIAGDQRQ